MGKIQFSLRCMSVFLRYISFFRMKSSTVDTRIRWPHFFPRPNSFLPFPGLNKRQNPVFALFHVVFSHKNIRRHHPHRVTMMIFPTHAQSVYSKHKYKCEKVAEMINNCKKLKKINFGFRKITLYNLSNVTQWASHIIHEKLYSEKLNWKNAISIYKLVMS